MARMTSQTGVRDELLHAGVRLLDDHGPDALQTRKVAAAAGTSTMAVYTHFGGMRGLIAAIAEEGLRQFDVALTVPQTADPVADLLAIGTAPALRHRAPAHVPANVRQHQRTRHQRASARRVDPQGCRDRTPAPQFRACGASGAPVPAGRPVRDRAWSRRRHGNSCHRGAVLVTDPRLRDARAGRLHGDRGAAVEPVLAAMTVNLLVALGDSPERAQCSLRAEQTQKNTLGRAT
ncbi:transcriptional repressor [Mycobacterium tuberculosis CAS/NITR204]|uniref:Transcriptional repressor n=1 Tax=Mycobacterium tuberculosis CAS/NITR204 TaxID=1310114 RepID=R4MDV2_MYCTX|nr:transcriptional repressor [Mycobacterium tuberculosis CAS/NITR204]